MHWKISWSIEATTLGVQMMASLSNLAAASAAWKIVYWTNTIQGYSMCWFIIMATWFVVLIVLLLQKYFKHVTDDVFYIQIQNTHAAVGKLERMFPNFIHVIHGIGMIKREPFCDLHHEINLSSTGFKIGFTFITWRFSVVSVDRDQ